MSRNDSAHAKVWVGRVKSNVAPEFLETAFQKIGKLIKVETGFAGVAFVDFVHEDDADAAVKELHKQFVPNIGEILVSRATQRGYESACQKRDIYQRSKGKVGEVYHCGDRGSRGLADEGRRSRSRSRSRSKSRSRSRSRGSRSGSPKRQRNSRSRSHHSRGRSRSPSRRSRSKSAGSKSKRSASRPRSPSKRRSPSKSNVQLQPREDQAEPPQEDRRSKSPESRHSSKSPEPREKSKSPEARRSPSPEPAPPAEAKMAREPLARPEPSVKKKLADDHGQTKVDSALRKCQDLLAVPSKVIEEVVPVTQDPYAVSDMSAEAPEQRLACHSSSSSLSLQERAAVVQFFDGASVRELLLESAAVVAVPDLFLPEMMNGFPHSFQSLSQDGVINLLAVFAAFVRGGGAGAHAAFDSDLSVEVRQTLTVNAQGRRVMRKTLLVDGIRCASEEQAL